MRTERCIARAIGAAALTSVFAGCSAGGASLSSAPPAQAASQLRETSATGSHPIMNVLPPRLQYLVRQPTRTTDVRGRIPGGKKAAATVFVADFTNSDITCFNEKGGVVGQITSLDGLYAPQGIDYYQGVLYVANTGLSNILEYDGCSGTLLATLNDPGQQPVDVTRSPDGHVYVSNIATSNFGPGSISVYAPGATNPSSVVTAGVTDANNYFVTTDAQGNLYATWRDLTGGAHVQCFTPPVTSPGVEQGIGLGFPGGIKWYPPNNVVVSDQDTGIYGLSGGSCASGGWTQNTTISSQGEDWIDIALNNVPSTINRTAVSSHNANQLSWPSGTLTHQFIWGFRQPIGVANSKAKR